MTTHQIVDILLGEDEDYYYAFVGEPVGFLGVVTADGQVKAKATSMEYEHQEMGFSFHDARWRYATNRKIPTVGWSTDFTEDQKNAVTAWLNAKGFKVAGHTSDLTKWFFP